jgi:cell wall assembly regulator SMI1
MLLTPQLTTADRINRHVAQSRLSRKELERQQGGFSAPVLQPCVAPRGTILARSDKNFAKSKQASDKSHFATQIYWQPEWIPLGPVSNPQYLIEC